MWIDYWNGIACGFTYWFTSCCMVTRQFKDSLDFMMIRDTYDLPTEQLPELQFTRWFNKYLATAIQRSLNHLLNRQFKGSWNLLNCLVIIVIQLMNSLGSLIGQGSTSMAWNVFIDTPILYTVNGLWIAYWKLQACSTWHSTPQTHRSFMPWMAYWIAN